MSDLSLYFHLPFCRRRCRYCSFVTQAGREALIPEYVAALEAELRLRRRSGAVVRTIYFGGGTPSLAGAELIGRLVRSVPGLKSPWKPIQALWKWRGFGDFAPPASTA
jgi:oxygen-independent coproporphyrinogen-3 oxidase